MSGVQEGRCCGAFGKKTVLVRGNEMVRDTEVREKGVDMFFKELTDKTEEGDGSIVGWGAGCRGGFGDGDNEGRFPF